MAEALQSTHAELLDWHRQLIKLRRDEPALNDGRRDFVVIRSDEEGRWLVMERQAISVVCNLSPGVQTVVIRDGKHQILMASAPGVAVGEGGLRLPPDSVAILKKIEAT